MTLTLFWCIFCNLIQKEVLFLSQLGKQALFGNRYSVQTSLISYISLICNSIEVCFRSLLNNSISSLFLRSSGSLFQSFVAKTSNDQSANHISLSLFDLKTLEAWLAHKVLAVCFGTLLVHGHLINTCNRLYNVHGVEFISSVALNLAQSH